MQQKTKVFVVNRGGHDYSAAERFGELVYLSDGLFDRYKTNQMYRVLSEGMKDSTATDYLLLTSLPTLCTVAAAIFAAKHQCLNLLLFHNGEYMSRTLSFNNPSNNGEDS